MLALEVEYLMGRVLASTRGDRRAVEWPPHPSRLFSAFVAAYKECDLGEHARAALEWFETLSEPPAICAHPPEHGNLIRDSHDVFVPVNDSSEIPERRSKQVRWFPAFTPTEPYVWFIWNETPGIERHFSAIQRIAENVAYLGHSMSPVRIKVGSLAPSPTLIPDEFGSIMLRTTGKGRLQHLENVYDLRKDNTTIQPRLGRVTRYRIVNAPQVQHPASVFYYAYVFKFIRGGNFPPESAERLITTIRKAVMELYPNPVPDIISGHDALGKPLQKPHLAVAPFLDVGHPYADGHIMGFAIWLPYDASTDVIETLEDALSDFNSLTLGKLGRWEVRRVTGDIAARAAKGLRLETYTQFHDTWASVTPVLFGKYPKKSQIGPGKDGGKVFAELCEMIGLPKPIEARIGPVSAFLGTPMASEFMPPKKFESRLRAHAWIRFSEPVQGPVIIGAGRFFGFGLCRPWFG